VVIYLVLSKHTHPMQQSQRQALLDMVVGVVAEETHQLETHRLEAASFPTVRAEVIDDNFARSLSAVRFVSTTVETAVDHVAAQLIPSGGAVAHREQVIRMYSDCL
jgi:hypothetical protein